MKHWVKVVRATFHHAAGNSILKPGMPLGNTWELELEDGSVINYPVRYKKQDGKYARRGWYHRRHSDDALPPPKKVLRKIKN